MSDKIERVMDCYELDVGENFFTQRITVDMDRCDLLFIIGMIELALRHPEVSDNLKRLGRGIGGQFLTRLLDDGLSLPDEVKEAFFKTFEMGE